MLKTILAILALLALGALLGVLAPAQTPCTQQQYDALRDVYDALLPSAFNNDELGAVWKDVDDQLSICNRAVMYAKSDGLQTGEQWVQVQENQAFAIAIREQCHPPFWRRMKKPFHRAPAWCR